MSYSFFRKERENVFEGRFAAIDAAVGDYRITNGVIFQAKNQGVKKFAVKLNSESYYLISELVGNELLIRSDPAKFGRKIPVLRFSEGTIADVLKNRRTVPLHTAIADKLCKDHATSSASSPLISGCNEDNFAASRTYGGYKLHLEMTFRQPFQNPHVSGLEKEYFLIGRVLETDCESIYFCGKTAGAKDQTVCRPVQRLAALPAPVSQDGAGDLESARS